MGLSMNQRMKWVFGFAVVSLTAIAVALLWGRSTRPQALANNLEGIAAEQGVTPQRLEISQSSDPTHRTTISVASDSAAAEVREAPSSRPETVSRHGGRFGPRSLDEVQPTPKLIAALRQLPPLTFDLFQYRLKFLDRFLDCLGSRALSRGSVRFDFVFEMEGPGSRVGRGTRVLIQETDLSSQDQALLLECAGAAHYGHTVRVQNDVGEPLLHWMPYFRLPIDENEFAYTLIRTGELAN